MIVWRHVVCTLVRTLLAFVVLGFAACGSAEPSAFFDDSRFLRFGVDPLVEADAVESQMKRAGFVVAVRVQGQHHIALGFVDETNGRTAVRIVTALGTKLLLNSDADATRPRQYRLLAADALPGVRRLPADEVFVSVAGERGDGACIAAFRAQSDGAVARIVIDAGAVVLDGCASELQDVDDNGSPELVVHAAFLEFTADDPPLVRVPLSAYGGGYRWVAGIGPVTALLRQQQLEATQNLAAARRSTDVPGAFRSAVELAAISRFEGASMGDQLKVFDEALRGLVLTGRQAAMVEHARHLIRHGWMAEETPSVPVEATVETPVESPAETVDDAPQEVPLAP